MLLFVLSLLYGPPVSASTIVGVTGDTNTGSYSQNSFYLIDTDTGESTKKGAASVTSNQVAFNQETQTYYYMNHYGTDLYSYDIDGEAESWLGDLTSSGMPTGETGSGGGEFYNGKYY